MRLSSAWPAPKIPRPRALRASPSPARCCNPFAAWCRAPRSAPPTDATIARWTCWKCWAVAMRRKQSSFSGTLCRSAAVAPTSGAHRAFKRANIPPELNNLPKFEECLQRLEKIVQELEKGEAPLEKSLTLFEEGMQLSSACRKELEQAEGKVEILLKQNGKLQAVAFEPESEKSSALR